MYQHFFNFKLEPFSIAPDPRFLYMSEQHKEALAHLLYGIQSSGAFVVLSGEVGSGKTTVCRCFLEQVPDNVDIAFLLNPKLNAEELLASICDEFSIPYNKVSLRCKELIDAINHFLLENHAKGRNTVVIIEEAQNLSADVLEQLRLLTNLETSEKKLLQIVLLAQPELLDTLKQNNMRQLAQRITARFHLSALNRLETEQYILHRLRIAGAQFDPFSKSAKRLIYRQSKGIPRLINLICDRALLGAYAKGSSTVDRTIVAAAMKELRPSDNKKLYQSSALLVLALIAVMAFFFIGKMLSQKEAGISLSGKFTAPAMLAARQSVPPAITENELTLASFDDAVSALLAAWDLPDLGIQQQTRLSENNFCQLAQTNGLACLRERGNIGTLLKLGRPAILKLWSASGESGYGVLLGQSNHSLLLQVDDDVVEYTFPQIERAWLGEYLLFWKPPVAYTGGLIRPGDSGLLVYWLNERLQNFIEQQAFADETVFMQGDSFPSRYEVTQQRLVETLQRQAGIHPDGIVGVKTFIYLNSMFDETVPKLVTPMSEEAR